LFLVSCPLFHVSLLVPCLLSSVPNLMSLFLVSRSLSPILNLYSLYPIHLSRQFEALYWFRMRWIGFWVCSMCDEIVSKYAQHVMNFIPHMLSMRWNRFHVCLACSVPWNRFHVCSVNDKINSAYSVCACYTVQKLPQTAKLKCKFWQQFIKILKNRLGAHLIGPK
jgi:hypothetical protein